MLEELTRMRILEKLRAGARECIKEEWRGLETTEPGDITAEQIYRLLSSAWRQVTFKPESTERQALLKSLERAQNLTHPEGRQAAIQWIEGQREKFLNGYVSREQQTTHVPQEPSKILPNLEGIQRRIGACDGAIQFLRNSP